MGQPHSLSQAQPGLDPALAFVDTVVVANAVQPDPAHLADWAVRDDGRVFDGDVFLIVESVGDPAFDLLRLQLAAVHILVERVFIVIMPGADGL